MPGVLQYRKLAKEYGLKALRVTDPLYAEGYRRLAEGYISLAQGFAILVEAHRSANDRPNDVHQPVSGADRLGPLEPQSAFSPSLAPPAKRGQVHRVDHVPAAPTSEVSRRDICATPMVGGSNFMPEGLTDTRASDSNSAGNGFLEITYGRAGPRRHASDQEHYGAPFE